MEEEEVSADLMAKLMAPSVEYLMISRAGWNAQEPQAPLKPLQLPVKYVFMAYNTGVAGCASKEECKERVREIQRKQMALGLPDLHYNFLVGGDGNLYEGRGWKYQPESFKDREDMDGKGICVGVIGDHNDFEADNQLDPLIHTVYIAQHGEEHGYVEEDYEMITDEQTFDK